MIRWLLGAPRPPGPLIGWRIACFGVGAGIYLAGLFLELDWATAVAICVLLTGLVLGVLDKPG